MARKRNIANDRAGIGPDPDRGGRLVSIDRLEAFRFGDDDVDVRGWEVRTVGGRQLGDVKDLLVDPEAGEVIMLEIELAHDGRRALAPIRAAQIDRDRRSVIIDSGDIERHAASRERRDHHDGRADREYDDRERTSHAEPAHTGERASADDGTEEVVVERRPVAFEEVVVRRRNVDPDRDRPADR
jgi:sporulation protein YlmC with PRC-barrel domain